MTRIIYDRKTDTFVRYNKKKADSPEQVYFDFNINKDLHEFLHNINEALRDEYCDIVMGEEKLVIKRKKITGEVIGCSVYYANCLPFINSPYRFIEFYL